jgi:hypothetical protein
MMEIDATLSKKIELDYNAQKLILKLKYGNVLENITGHIGTQKYLCTITWKRPTYMDEPKSIEGKDLGPDPFLHLASLAACTAIYLENVY